MDPHSVLDYVDKIKRFPAAVNRTTIPCPGETGQNHKRSGRMLCNTVEIRNVFSSKQRTGLIFKGRIVQILGASFSFSLTFLHLKMRPMLCLETSGTNRPVARCHMAQERKLHHYAVARCHMAIERKL